MKRFSQILSIILLVILIPTTSFASQLNTMESVDEVQMRSNQNITKLDLIKILLEKDGFNKELETKEDQIFEDVDIEYRPQVEKMRQLGVIHFNSDNPRLSPNRELSLWKLLYMVFKYEGIPVKKFLIETETFESQVQNIAGHHFMAPVFEKALELGLVKPNQGKIFFLRPVKLPEFISILEQLNSDSPARTTVKTVINPVTDLQKQDTYKVLENVWNRIKRDYIENNTIDETKLLYGAIEGMVEALDDPFSTFQVPKEYSEFKKNLSSKFEGIGASLYMNENDELEIISPISNSPAESAGLLPGDIITKANGIKLKGLSIEDAIDLIKGPSGTQVQLEIERGSETLEFKITRAKIDIPLVSAEVHSGNIGYIKIRSFGFSVSDSFKKLYDEIDPETNNLIIDLRSNPGGYLNEAIKIADLFLPANKAIVNVKYNDATEITQSEDDKSIQPGKIAILINKGSASASEILAAALKENLNNVTIIGENSFGKGTVQELISYTDNSALKLTIAEWLSPTMKKINKVGVRPDIEVISQMSDLSSKNDPVLNRALLELR